MDASDKAPTTKDTTTNNIQSLVPGFNPNIIRDTTTPLTRMIARVMATGLGSGTAGSG
jgi:hypothetical protein